MRQNGLYMLCEVTNMVRPNSCPQGDLEADTF
ncbi:hypothetical protein ES707_11958 [subsurface metagenome]